MKIGDRVWIEHALGQLTEVDFILTFMDNGEWHSVFGKGPSHNRLFYVRGDGQFWLTKPEPLVR